MWVLWSLFVAVGLCVAFRPKPTTPSASDDQRVARYLLRIWQSDPHLLDFVPPSVRIDLKQQCIFLRSTRWQRQVIRRYEFWRAVKFYVNSYWRYQHPQLVWSRRRHRLQFLGVKTVFHQAQDILAEEILLPDLARIVGNYLGL